MTMKRLIIIIGIIANLVVPGLGTLMMGKWVSGFIQLALIAVIWLVGAITFGLAGFIVVPLHGLVWLWALGGGVWALIKTPKRELPSGGY